MSKKNKLVAFPLILLAQLEHIAQVEGRNFSDLMREAGRRYVESFNQKQRKTSEDSDVGS